MKRYRRRLADNFSREDQVQLPWLRNLLWGISIVMALGLIQNFIRFLSGFQEAYEFMLLLSGGILLGFFG
ncbi:MAG: hypothetical protein AAF696_00075 [Bacteroidota bacterium]